MELLNKKEVLALIKDAKEKETGAFTKGYNKALKDIYSTINSGQAINSVKVDLVEEPCIKGVATKIVTEYKGYKVSLSTRNYHILVTKDGEYVRKDKKATDIIPSSKHKNEGLEEMRAFGLRFFENLHNPRYQ